MKHLLIALLLLFPLGVNAEVPQGVMGFMDGKLYDESSFKSGIPKYLCFMDGNCYDKEMKFVFNRGLSSPALTSNSYTLLTVPNQWFPRATDDSSVSEINIVCKNIISDLVEVKCSNGTQYKINVKSVLFNMPVRFNGDYQTINDSVVLSYRDDLVIPFIANPSNTIFVSDTYAKFSVPVSFIIPASDTLGIKTETIIRAKGYGSMSTASLILININGKDIIYKVQ